MVRYEWYLLLQLCTIRTSSRTARPNGETPNDEPSIEVPRVKKLPTTGVSLPFAHSLPMAWLFVHLRCSEGRRIVASAQLV